MKIVTLFREFHFSAAHRLANPGWTQKKNRLVFGSCSNSNFHGHNYRLLLAIKAVINPLTGFAFDLQNLNVLVKRKILIKFDHKNLNMDIKELKKINPTVENVAAVIWRILWPEFKNIIQLKVVLFETEKISVEFSGEEL